MFRVHDISSVPTVYGINIRLWRRTANKRRN